MVRVSGHAGLVTFINNLYLMTDTQAVKIPRTVDITKRSLSFRVYTAIIVWSVICSSEKLSTYALIICLYVPLNSQNKETTRETYIYMRIRTTKNLPL